MFVRKIQIDNFRSHVSTTLDLTALTFIRGANAVGKSSIEQAIQITLAGRTDATSADGKGSAGLIRAGAAKASITLAVQQDDEERIVKCALNGTSRAVVVVKPGDPQYSGGTEYTDYLALHRDVLSCLTNNRFFVDQKEADQKDILARIILPKTYTWPDWVMPAANELGLKINWAKTPFEVIDEAYDAAFAERTNVNRDLKNFKMPEGLTDGHDMYDTYSLKLRTRKIELDAAKAKKFAAEGDARSAGYSLHLAMERLAQAENRIKREETLLVELDAKMLPPKKLKELEVLAKKATESEKLDVLTAELNVSLRLKKEALTALNKFDEIPQCPTCGTGITPELIATLAQPIIAEINDLSEKSRQAFDNRKALGDPADAKTQVDAHHQAVKDQVAAKGRIREEQTAVTDAESKIDELKAASKVDTSALDAEILEMSNKVDFGTKAVEEARVASELKSRKDAATIQKAKLTDKQQMLEKLVAYFGADGVKAELLAASIGTFTDAMNDTLNLWGYECQLSIDPYVFAIMFRDGGGIPMPIGLKHLSKSQRYRFSTAFQIALAIVTGFRFVIVDEADIYDGAGKSGLFDALTSGELHQAIVLATDERETAPPIEGAIFYRLINTSPDGELPTTQVQRLTSGIAQAA